MDNDWLEAIDDLDYWTERFKDNRITDGGAEADQYIKQIVKMLAMPFSGDRGARIPLGKKEGFILLIMEGELHDLPEGGEDEDAALLDDFCGDEVGDWIGNRRWKWPELAAMVRDRLTEPGVEELIVASKVLLS